MSEYKDIDLLEHSDNKYKLLNGNIIGTGAFSQVYLCNSTEKTNNTTYVVKIQLKREKKYAINELNILNKVNKHNVRYNQIYENKYNMKTNLVKRYDYFISSDYIYIIYEKCDINLEHFNIKFLQTQKSNLPAFIIDKIIYSLFNGINELNYNNIIHCDLKLDNILIKFNNVTLTIKNKKKTRQINNMEDFLQLVNTKGISDYEDVILKAFDVKIIDFNKSCFINQISKSTSVQTIYYQAPEIILGNSDFNESIDSWSIGCIIWWLLSGELLFDIYNYNIKFGKYYKDYDSKDDSDTESNDLSSYMSQSYGYSYDDYRLENYIYLLKIKSLIGAYTKEFIIGGNTDDYIRNELLLCSSVEIKQTDMLSYLLNKKDNISEEYIKKIYETIIEKIFTYDYKNRLCAKDIIQKKVIFELCTTDYQFSK